MRDIYIYLYIYMQKFTIMYKPPPYSKSQLLLSDLLLATKGLTFDTELPYISMDCLRDSGLTFNLGGYHFTFDAETMTIEEKVGEGGLYTLVDLKEDKLFSGDNSGSGYIPITTGLSVNGVSLDSGYATITEEVTGTMACGQNQTRVPASAANVDAFGAIPQTFYKQINGQQYNPDGLLSCNNCCDRKYDAYGGGCPIILDADQVDLNPNTNICYKLTTNSGISFTIIPNDTCNGNCIGLMDSPPKENNGCISGKSPSCMNVQPRELAWATQNLPQNRCPPIIFCDAQKNNMNPADIQSYLIKNYKDDTQIRSRPMTKEQALPYAPVQPEPGTEEVGQCDWCSGKNMHFDVQFDPSGSLHWDKETLKTGQVVKYQLIKCPNPYFPISPGSPIGACEYKSCNDDPRGGYNNGHESCVEGGCSPYSPYCYDMTDSYPPHGCCFSPT